MKRFIIAFVVLGLAVVSSLQAGPTIIASGSGTGYFTGINVAPVLSGAVPGTTAPPYLITNNIPSSTGWNNPIGTSKWVTFDSTGTGTPTTSAGQDACVGTICNDQFVSFYEDFTASVSSFGTLKVMADDTAAVWVNGNKVIAENTSWTVANNYATCSNSAIGCLNPDTVGTVNLAGLLVNGQNRIVFQVFQRSGTGYGVDYYGSVVPEPGFYGVLALGLSGLCFAIRRKRSA